MHWVELEGLLVPTRVGGHPALDLCNTWAGWGEVPNPRREWLKTYDHFVVWAMHAELISLDDVRRLRRSSARNPHESRAILADVRRLRASARAALLDPTNARAMASVTGYVRRSGSTARLAPGSRPQWVFPAEAGLGVPLFATAWAVGDLLTSGRLDDIRACPGHDCGWLFLDGSGRRRWCSMDSCGNRAKVRAFAQRHRRHGRG